MQGAVAELVGACHCKTRRIFCARRFVSAGALGNFYKAHVLSFIAYKTPGVYHATTSVLDPLDRIPDGFLRELGISDVDALVNCNLAFLVSRRDLAM